jgi:hypothetical protein
VKEIVDQSKQKFWVNEDNVEYIADVGTEYAVRFTSGAVLRVDENVAKELIEGYAKKRKNVQPRSKAGKV